MKLYKEYKQEQERLAKENKDKEAINLKPDTVIIYEKSNFMSAVCRFMKNMILLLLFACLIFIITAAVVAGMTWLGKGVLV